MNDDDPLRELTTTSYALLGHLAMREWTMYDLAKQMRVNVHFFYPRAESQVYEEPKRLVRLRLATARQEAVGKRPRTVYAITDEGREALSAWLREPPSKGPQLEFEGLMRVMLGPFGTPDDARQAVQHAADEIADLLTTAERMQQLYLTGEAPFQRYALYRAFMHDFLSNFGVLVDDWADRTLATMEAWETMTPDEQMAEAMRRFSAYGGRRPRRRRTGS